MRSETNIFVLFRVVIEEFTLGHVGASGRHAQWELSLKGGYRKGSKRGNMK